MKMSQNNFDYLSLGIVGGAALFLGSCCLSAVLTERRVHVGSRGTDSGFIPPGVVKEVMRELDPVDSLYFDISVARHALEERDSTRAKTWLDTNHALGELYRSIRLGFVSPKEGSEIEKEIADISRLIDERQEAEVRRRIIALQTRAGEMAYSAIAQKFKEKGVDPPEYMDHRFEPIREKKKAEWIAKGYSPGLIEKGLRWAEDWARGIATRFVKPPELAAVVAESIYPEALELSEQWISAMAK